MATAEEALGSARSLLFVPGNRPDRFQKAQESGADLVVLDLEDGVAPEDKVTARDAVTRWLDCGRICAVRINPPGTPWHDGDLEAVAGYDCVLMLPKAEDPQSLQRIGRAVPGTPVLALIETAKGILDVREIASSPEVQRLAFGSYDLAAELRMSPEAVAAMAVPRNSLVLASAAAGLPQPVDGVTGAVRDDDLVRRDAARSMDDGFGGKLCIHPSQVALVNMAFRPNAQDIEWARAVVSASQFGVLAVVEGQMVDKPILARARRLLAAAEETEAGSD